MKSLERLVLTHLRSLEHTSLGPLQFAYRPLMFYHSVLASAVVCWGSRVRAADANKLNKLIGSVLGVELDSLVAERRMLHKMLSIMDNMLPPHCNQTV